jgi:hypothetical protein
VPGQSKGAGDQAQIASKQRISQGKGHEPSCLREARVRAGATAKRRRAASASRAADQAQ